MKTTFDLPEPLLRRAKAAAAHQGRPLRDLVADALESKLSADDALARAAAEQDNAWAAFTLRLQKLPDGTYFNPEGIADEGFFEALDLVRAEGRAIPWRPPVRQPHRQAAGPQARRHPLQSAVNAGLADRVLDRYQRPECWWIPTSL